MGINSFPITKRKLTNNYLSCHFHGLQGYYSLMNLRITGTGGNIEKHEQPLTFVELSRQNDKAIELIRMETSV